MNRSYLYVPGDRPDRLAKGLTKGADAIIADLEDGVAATAKAEARDAVCALLENLTLDGAAGVAGVDGTAGVPHILVRVNPGQLMADDVRAVMTAGADAIYLPKATMDSLRHCSEQLDQLESADPGRRARSVRVVPLIENARGLLDAPEMACHDRVHNLALGEADLTAELGIEPSADGSELLFARSTVVVASAAAGLDPPTAPVSTDFRDLESLRAETVALRRLGFGARSAIHPSQLGVINDVFTPTAAELERATALVARFEESLVRGEGVCVDTDGTMVDEAVVRSARRILARRTS